MEANEIGTYCGETLPPTIVSTTESLWLNFMSDFSVVGNGFRLEYITNGLYWVEKLLHEFWNVYVTWGRMVLDFTD